MFHPAICDYVFIITLQHHNLVYNRVLIRMYFLHFPVNFLDDATSSRSVIVYLSFVKLCVPFVGKSLLHWVFGFKIWTHNFLVEFVSIPQNIRILKLRGWKDPQCVEIEIISAVNHWSVNQMDMSEWKSFLQNLVNLIILFWLGLLIIRVQLIDNIFDLSSSSDQFQHDLLSGHESKGTWGDQIGLTWPNFL